MSQKLFLEAAIDAVQSIQEEIAGKRGKDQNYSADMDSEKSMGHVHSALQYSEKKGYKVNHHFADGHVSSDESGTEPAHKSPDVTFHHSDEPHSYVVHHNGAAAHDSKLHKKAIHFGDD